MRASGNGNVKVCAENLLRTYRGEVPYERIKGLDSSLLDRPTQTVSPEIQQDARWVLETYEPRATVESVSVAPGEGTGNALVITANIKGEGAINNA